MDIDDVLAGRGGLEGIQRMLSGPAARAVLRAALGELVGMRSLGACRLHRAKYRTGRRLSAYYDVRVGDHRRPIAVTWTPPTSHRTQPASQPVTDPMEGEAIERGLASPFRRLVTEVESRGMRIQVAPADAEFPQLVRVSDPAHAPTVLVAAGMCVAPSVTVTAVRYRPGRRHLLRYDSGPASVFVKLYRDSERAARAWRVAVGVADRLAQAPVVRAVRPLVALADDAVVAYPRVVGVPLSQHLARHRPGVGQHLSAAGVALRALHRDSLPGALLADLEPRCFADEAKKVASACEHIHTLLPEVGRRIAAVLSRAHELHDELPQEPPTFAYGDLKADHLWVTRGGLVLIDFDTCALADPALDVGKFLADLQWWLEDRPGPVTPAQAQAHFLDAYQAPSERLHRARVYEALVLLKITAHRVRLFDRDWTQRTTRLIDRAEAVLADLEHRVGRRPARVRATATTSS